MDKAQIFRHIQTPYKKSLIYTRLGYEKTNTHPSPDYMKQIDKWIFEAQTLCDVVVLYRKMPVYRVDEEWVALEEGISFESKALVCLMKNSSEAVLMAASSGDRITDKIRQLQQDGEMAKALVYDAAASEITDAGLDWLTEFIRRPLISQGKNLTHMRFSPGYGDLKLENQRIFFNMLDLGELGIELTEKYILLPEKTVTAVIGIETPESPLRE